MLAKQVFTHNSFGSGRLAAPRKVRVYTPPDYADTDQRCGVLYLQDGQNLFDPSASFAGVAWGADKTANALILRRKIPPLIIVGVDNTGHERLNEYTPAPYRGRGGKADGYAQFLIEEVKPFIDENYRTLSGREFTGLGGSSLGGLFALWLGVARPDVFSRLAVMSPSLWWADGDILRQIAALPTRQSQRVWLDIGRREGRPFKAHTRHLQEIFLSKGWRKNRNARLADFRYLEAPQARHDEASWGARFDKVLRFLYPA
jgi:predicted alpha/beta superfamily hydrolase